MAGFSSSSVHPITSFHIFSSLFPTKKFITSAVVVPRVTCDMPLHQSKLVSDLQLADPHFGQPGRIDLVEIFDEVMLDGRWLGAPGLSLFRHNFTFVFKLWLLCCGRLQSESTTDIEEALKRERHSV